MLDELLDDPMTDAEMEDLFGGVPATKMMAGRLAAIPAGYVRRNFDKSMAWAEEWAEDSFDVDEVNLTLDKGQVIFGPAMQTPIRHQ